MEARAAQERPQEWAASPTFIEAYPFALSQEVCEDIIARFEADPRKRPSGTARGVNTRIRLGTMLDIPAYAEWADICALVTRVTRECVDKYMIKYPSLQSMARPENCRITEPLVERITPGQGYGFHIDAGPGNTYDRFLSGLLYLRDIRQGGQTEFPFQRVRVPPTAGMLVLFPPFWTHLHRGMSPALQTKYNITNFLVIDRNT
jgi:hypothetical protein